MEDENHTENNDLENDNSLSDSEGEEITPSKVLEVLENAWKNELSAPEILPHKQEMLDLMISQIETFEKILMENPAQDFRFVIHQMELKRIRYLLANYLRVRLRKIEEFTEHILDEESKRSGEHEKRLTSAETEFAQELLANVEAHLNTMALQHMPTAVRTTDRMKRIVTPNLNAYIVVRANVEKTVGGDFNSEDVNMRVNSQHVMPYKQAANLVINGDVQLI